MQTTRVGDLPIRLFYSPLATAVVGHAAPEYRVGYIPLGLVGCTLLVVAASLFCDVEIAWSGFPMLALVFLHIAAVVYYCVKKGRNLLTPMVRGDKQTELGTANARDDLVARLLAVLVLAVCGVAVTFTVTVTAILAWAA